MTADVRAGSTVAATVGDDEGSAIFCDAWSDCAFAAINGAAAVIVRQKHLRQTFFIFSVAETILAQQGSRNQGDKTRHMSRKNLRRHSGSIPIALNALAHRHRLVAVLSCNGFPCRYFG